MDADRELEAARRAEPAWDELRERRVLSRVLSERESARARQARGRAAALGGLVVAVAAAVAIGLVAGRGPSETAVAGHEVAPAPAPASPPGTPGRLALRDGSEVELGPEARIELEEDAPGSVRIAQHAGEARYVVSHRPERAFVVVAGSVEVRVRGTRFVVRRLEGAVEVEVEDGRVEVARGDEAHLLVRGDALRISTASADAPAPATEPAAPAEPEVALEVVAPATVEARPRRAPPRAEGVAPSPAPEAPPVGMEQMLAEADAARRAGRLEDASRALRAAIAAHAEDPRAATALFLLGRVERTRGRDAAAAEAFEAGYARDPDAVLAEDALAEAAVSWSAASRSERAREAARRYLARYPAGEYADRVRHLAE